MVINNINYIYIMCNNRCRFIYNDIKCTNKRQFGKPYCQTHVDFFKELSIKKKNKTLDKTFLNSIINNK
jgi:hypothetical protein